MSVPEVRRTRIGNIVWTPEMDEVIIENHRRNIPFSAIAEYLGVTRNAVIGRAWRLRKNGRM